MDKKNPVYRKRSMVWRYRWKEELLACGALMAFAFFINRGMGIRGLAGDDLRLWYHFSEDSFWKFLFPGDQCRFLYRLAACLEFIFVGNHMEWFVPVNIVVNSLIAYTVFRAARRISGRACLGFGCGLLYLLSSLSCRQIGQVSGLAESLGLWAAIAILYMLYLYQHRAGAAGKMPAGFQSGENENGAYYWTACGLYGAVCFIHQRYLALVLLFVLAMALRREKKPARWIVPPVIFACALAAWFLAGGGVLGARLSAGDGAAPEAGGAAAAAGIILRQFLNLAGIHLGPADAGGHPWTATARLVQLAVAAECLLVLGLIVLFAVRFVRDRNGRRTYLRDMSLFAAFILLCMAGSLFSSGLEIGRAYGELTVFWMLLAYMCGAVAGHSYADGQMFEWRGLRYHRGALIGLGLTTAYLLLMFGSERYYRGFYAESGLWQEQSRANSLAQETWGRCGEELSGKKIYILENSYGLSQEDADTFFRTFFRGKKDAGPRILFADSIRDFGQVTQNMLILREDTETKGYQNVTDMVKKLKCEAIYGYYPDGWMEETAKVRVMAGSTGRIELQLLYPEVMTGEEVMKIRMDGEEAAVVRISQSILYVTLETVPYRTVELDFENNFYQGSTVEQRSDKRLSIMVNITAD